MNRLAWVISILLVAAPGLAQQRKAPVATIDQGVQQVEEGDFETAVTTLDQAVRVLANDVAHSRERARAYLYMGIAYLGMSEEANAKARLLDALKQDHDLNLNPRQFSPRVLALFEQAKKEAAGSPSASRVAGGNRASLFFLAVKSGDFAAVSQMLKEDPGLIGERDGDFGATPLHWAALKGHEVVTGLLLSAGADQTSTNRDGETPLKVAQRAGRESVVRLLRSQENRIYNAIRIGDVDTVRTVLDKDPTLLNKKDAEFGATPLHWAALKGQDAVIGLLLARGADATLTNGAGETPLAVAERAKQTGAISLLSPIDAALISAVRTGDVAAVRQILERDAALVSRPDGTFGATPLHWAALKGQTEVVSYLLSIGADAKALNSAGETPLQVAERAKKKEVVALLAAGTASPAPAVAPAAVQRKAAASAGSLEDLLAAARSGDTARVRQILEASPSLLNRGDEQYGATALHWAAARGNAEVVAFLVSAGADGTLRNKAGETPLDVAERAKKTEIIAILSGLGENPTPRK